MSTIRTDSESWIGRTLSDGTGQKIGAIEEIYFDEASGSPLWMVVSSGLFGSRHSFVPLADAFPRGATVVTPYGRSEIAGSPKIDRAEDLGDDEVRELYRYYGLPVAPAPGGDHRDTPLQRPAERVLSYLM